MIPAVAAVISAVMSTFVHAGVVSIEFNETGFFFSNAPTHTFVWPARQPQATLIFIPGGEGRLGIKPERTTLGGFYGATLKPLSDETQTKGLFNVVVFDSPTVLPVGRDYPYSRQSREHLLRIESVVRYFKDLYRLPIWIMGHSNGAASITEFYKMLQESGNEHLVEGAVYSSARDGADFSATTQLPILFLAHERDSCEKSQPSRSRAVFERQTKTNSMQTRYVLIKGGEPQAQHVCYSGFHMYFGASQEVQSAIDRFFIELKMNTAEDGQAPSYKVTDR